MSGPILVPGYGGQRKRNSLRSNRADTMSRDDYMSSVTIGERRRVDGPVHLADYDPDWPVLYKREAARVRGLLGDRVRLLEHVGSTSVPGLPAKPVLDMLLAVADSADEPAYVPSLESGGYALWIREPDWHEHRLFKGPDTNVNLHTFSAGCIESDRMLLFRDWLRTNPADRDRYLAVKRELAERNWTNVQQYAEAKSDIIADILARASAPPTRPQ